MEFNIRGTLRRFDRPAIMGIINVTPDSFFAASRIEDTDELRHRATAMVASGADILDIGACSTRPGSPQPDEAEELRRLIPAVIAVRGAVGQSALISVDTYRARVAREAVAAGADIVNDISGGKLDDGMPEAVACLKVPYVLMHMRGTPQTMQSMTDYGSGPGSVKGIVPAVIRELSAKLAELHRAGVADIIIDPGFGFAKTMEQNYELLRNLRQFQILGCPVLAGLSRKSMATKLLGIDASEALNATTVLNTLAIHGGADILRVHDVAEAAEVIKICEFH